MLLKRKLGTYIVTGGATYFMIFEAEYIRPDGKEDHAFRDIQKWYKKKINSMLGIEIPSDITTATQQSIRMESKKENNQQ